MYRLQMQFYLHARENPIYILQEFETLALAEAAKSNLHLKLELKQTIIIDEWELTTGPTGVQATKIIIRNLNG